MPIEPDEVTTAVQIACLLEVSAEKPGNVTRHRHFQDTGFSHFVVSAVALAPAFRAGSEASVGETILRAVRSTRQMVGTNTNLGIVLLLSPLAKAAGMSQAQGLRPALAQVLQALTVDDARKTYQAIRLAAPRGLGSTERYDVREAKVDITLREAMKMAQDRDAVAREYVTDFQITFETGYPTLCKLWAEGHRFSDAIVQTSLTILARVPDTLIARKNSLAVAEQVSRRAKRVLDAGGVLSERGREALRRFDLDLRNEKHSLNPGTTADLTTAAIFVFLTDDGALRQVPDLLHRW